MHGKQGSSPPETGKAPDWRRLARATHRSGQIRRWVEDRRRHNKMLRARRSCYRRVIVTFTESRCASRSSTTKRQTCWPAVARVSLPSLHALRLKRHINQAAVRVCCRVFAAILVGNLGRSSWQVILPRNLARQSCRAILPGNLVCIAMSMLE
jgi:hypothetical protein